jgi:glycosyltransferase involved in cell wall biosynthesis
VTGRDSHPFLAAVVVARNEEASVARCLRSVRAGLDAVGGGDLLLVDSASRDATARRGIDAGARVIRIRRASRICPAAARRIGAERTRSRHLLFVDADCELEPGFLPAAVEAIERDPSLGAVAGGRRDFYRTRRGIVPAPREYYPRGEGDPGTPPSYGGCALYRRRALEEAGSFDPYLNAREEEELGYRIREQGYRIEVLPVPMVRHLTVHRESFGRLLRTLRHGFFTGRGRALRRYATQGRWRAAFRGLGRALSVLGYLAAGVVCAAAAVSGTPAPLVAWAGAGAAIWALFALRTRSLRKALYYPAEWTVQALALIPGILAPLPPPARFRWVGDELDPSAPEAADLPRVLLVGPRPAPPLRGGVEKGVELLLRTGLARRAGMQVFDNYRARDPDRPLAERLRYQMGKLVAFRKQIRENPVDLVHVKTSSGINFHQNALYALLARRSGLRVVLQLHCGKFPVFYAASPAPVRAWIRHSLRAADRVVVLAPSWEGRLAAIEPRVRTFVVPNGLSEAEIESLREPGERRPGQVLFFGTGSAELDREKGLEELLAVLPVRVRAHPDSRWVLAGVGDPEAVRRRIAEECAGEAAGRTRVLGIVTGEEKAALLRESSILAFPSHYENMPNVLLEAMAAGMGIVAGDVGAVSEMLGAGEGGLLIAPGDRDALAASLDRLLDSPDLVREQGDANRRRVAREYTMRAVEQGLARLYREAAALGTGSLPEPEAAPGRELEIPVRKAGRR